MLVGQVAGAFVPNSTAGSKTAAELGDDPRLGLAPDVVGRVVQHVLGDGTMQGDLLRR